MSRTWKMCISQTIIVLGMATYVLIQYDVVALGRDWL